MSECMCYVKAGITEDVRASWRQLVCRKLYLYAHHEGEPYCVLHYPGRDKEDDFREAVDQKLADGNLDFHAVYFPVRFPHFLSPVFSPERLNKRASFPEATFEAGANFSGMTLEYANFPGATFKGVTHFHQATLLGIGGFERANFENMANFSEATFRDDVTFAKTTFAEADFQNTVFENEAHFDNTVIGEGNFSNARFKNETSFSDATVEGWVAFSIATFEKRAAFNDTTFNGAAHFSDTNFLQDVSFERTLFSSNADFSKTYFEEGAIFSGAILNGDGTFDRTTSRGSANFDDVTFRGYANFEDAKFRNAKFEDATFESDVDFTHATFAPDNATDFRRATFGREAYFKETEFKGDTDFYRANFLDAVKFIGVPRREDNGGLREVFALEGQVSFTRARMEKPELVSFDTLLLRPSWFVGVDLRKLQFINFGNVEWYGLPGGAKSILEDEVQRLEAQGITAPYRQFAKTCENLALMAENSGDYEVAGEFYYFSMDVRRKENWRTIGLTGYLYWALSGYGEKPRRALRVLLAICAVFAALYMVVGPSELRVFHTSEFSASVQHALQALVYSLGVLSRLGPKPEPHPGLFQFLVTVESILGPLQIAVLLLAVRRKILRERIFP